MDRRCGAVLLLLLLTLVGCGGNAEPEAEVAVAPAASATTTSSVTPLPSLTPIPSATVTPSHTPTTTPSPTITPTPSTTPSPTETPTPTSTPTPSLTPTPTPNASGEIVHTVSAGETIYTIATQYGVLWSQLTAYNSIPAAVEVGQRIRIPVGMMSQRYTGAGGAPLPSVASTSGQDRVVLGPVTFDWQRLNNCGPTTTSVMLSYYGINQPQLSIAGVVKPNPADKNVSPAEVAAYVRSQGLSVFVGVNGDMGLLERLVAAGYPVMVEQWMQYDGGVGHYRAVRGFDRERRQVLHEDTFLGPSIWRSYDEFLRDWAYFNNTYLVFYPPADEGTVAALVGNDWNRGAMWQRALDTYRQQGGAFALYGQAEALHQLGNSQAALPLYEQAIAAGLPHRYFWYRFGYLEALNNTGQYGRTLEFSAPILEAMGLSEDIRYHRAVAYRAIGQTESARRELTLALQDNPNFGPARVVLNQLPPPPTATPVPPTPTPEGEAPPPPPEGEQPPPEGDPPPPPPPEPTPGG